MNPDEFKPFVLEVKTLAEACVLKAKLDAPLSSDSAPLLEDALEDSDALDMLSDADHVLYERVKHSFKTRPEDYAALLAKASERLDEDGEFRVQLEKEGRIYLTKEDLPQLKRAVAAFETAAS